MPRRSRLLASVATVLVAGLALSGCAVPGDRRDDGTLTVYATTGYLADAVANIAPDAEVTTMVGPGGDPHTYQPSTRDFEKLRDADVVFWNGLHLEAQLIDLLQSLGNKQLAVGEHLPKSLLLQWPETDDAGNALYDPHIWNSPDAWSLVVGFIADKLSELDPRNAATYAANATRYQSEIGAAALEVERMLATIPAASRNLITGHDAFNYFGAVYNLKVYATDFVSTDAALSPQELSNLAQLIAQHRVPVIFQDNQANPQAITSLKEAVHALGWQVAVSDKELFADSLGADADVDTYLKVFLHNARAVASALGTVEQ